MTRYLRFGLSLGAVGVGLIHLRMAFRAVFVFAGDEPIWSWIVILAGPGSTFLAALVSWCAPRIAGTWLVGGSIVSAASLLILEGGMTPSFVPLLLRIAGPMAAVGIGLLLIPRRR